MSHLKKIKKKLYYFIPKSENPILVRCAEKAVDEEIPLKRLPAGFADASRPEEYQAFTIGDLE